MGLNDSARAARSGRRHRLHDPNQLLLRQRSHGGFFHALKVGLAHQRRWAGRGTAWSNVLAYIESCCNLQRIHSALGYRTPEQAEKARELTSVSTKPEDNRSCRWSAPRFDRTGGATVSDRLAGQAGCHGVFVRTIALSTPSRRRLQAIRATFLGAVAGSVGNG